MNDITVTQDKELYQRLSEMRSEVNDLAIRNIKVLTNGNGFTGPEVLALTEFEKLKLLSDYDLLTVMLRGESIQRIEDQNFHTLLPAKYGSAQEAIEIEGGLSPSEQSNIRDINEIIIPYVKSNMDISIAEFWQTKKSNLREIVPYLKVLITGEQSDRPSVNEAVDRVIGEIEEVGELSGNQLSEDEVKELAVETIINSAQNETSRGLREKLRPERTPPADAVIFFKDGSRIMIANVDGDQEQKIRSSNLFNFFEVDITKDKIQSYPPAKDLLGGSNGHD